MILNQPHPSKEQVRALRDRANGEAVAMLNLLKFRERAEYEDGRASELSGKEAYLLYAKAFRKLMEPKGVRVIFAGEPQGLVIGEGSELWDEVAIIEYPSAQVLLDMMRDPNYQKALPHRNAGLEGQLLMDCQSKGVAFTL
ncbi:Uncharacterised protein [Zhongshania aliphaticivorans]|uniref:DUF1330 domain-containing protein n=1 Tax=Zhongshania aliphaticivorans TaxID=1470434 RepID=A0A5S9NS19_9GAMM|nr:DUF1330 domain-containing protein [Zhongshania aliphaticivorans]CAA0093323.1 Uncharacterised protein [Zhongshania aliphaticivorans]CAA0111104.1 Uncharacterised protein [Zhongshania aliphaticivorans]